MDTRREFLGKVAKILPVALITDDFLEAQGLPKKPETQIQVVKYSVAEMQKFFAMYMNRILMQELTKDKYKIPEIQKHFTSLLVQTQSKYGEGLHIEASISYNENSADVTAGWRLNGNKPTVAFFMPAIIDKFNQDFRNKPNQDATFEVLIVASFIHELEHAVQDQLSVMRRMTLDVLIEKESDAWDKTCRYTLSEFIKKGYALDQSSQFYYNEWVKAGKQNNEAFKQSIRRAYSAVAKGFAEK